MIKVKFLFGQNWPPHVRSSFLWELLANSIAAFYIPVFQQYFLAVSIQNGVSDFQAGLISSAAAIGLFLTFIWTPLMQGRRKTPFMVLGGVVTRCVFVVISFLTMGWFTTIVFILINIGNAMTLPAYVDILGRVYPEQWRGKLLGYQRIFLSVLLISMTFAAGLILDKYHYQWPFVIAGILGALGSLTLIKLGEPDLRQEDRTAGEGNQIWRQFSVFKHNPGFRWFSIIGFIFGFGYTFGIPIYTIFQVKELELSNSEIGYIRIAFLIAWMAGFGLIGKLVKRFDLFQLLAASIILFGMVPFCYLFAGNYAFAIVGAAFQGLGESIFEIVFLMYLMKDPKNTAALVGISYALIGLRGAIAPAVSGALLGWFGYTGLFIVSAAVTFVSLAFVGKWAVHHQWMHHGINS